MFIIFIVLHRILCRMNIPLRDNESINKKSNALTRTKLKILNFQKKLSYDK